MLRLALIDPHLTTWKFCKYISLKDKAVTENVVMNSGGMNVTIGYGAVIPKGYGAVIPKE